MQSKATTVAEYISELPAKKAGDDKKKPSKKKVEDDEDEDDDEDVEVKDDYENGGDEAEKNLSL